MKIYLDCYPCFIKQAIQAGKFVTDDKTVIKEIVDGVAKMLPDLPPGISPPEIGDDIHRHVREVTGIRDPYRKAKDTNIEEAKQLFPEMKGIVEASENRLLTAAKIAIAGNIIDYGTNRDFNISTEIHSLIDQELGIDNFEEFKQALSTAGSVLYLADNAGESVLDRILIEEINAPVTYAVRGIPVLNDVTHEDAVASGIAEVAEIISSGTTAPGTILSSCNDNFLELFNKADVVISKGQGNYEALSDIDRSIFFLLRAKCPVVAEDLGVEDGDTILKGLNTAD
ncbi:MAG: hypothetical protein DRP60_08220 [Spirochaetes bacterium]|nr:MAG: hypothetical protein DRP60_08220 [Spirochaetota bacterium]